MKKLILTVLMLAPLGACSLDYTPPICRTKAPEVASMAGDTVLTTSGLRYIELAPGTGKVAPACSKVSIAYDAFAPSGVRFDSATVAAPSNFTAGGMQIPVLGLDIGVIGMRTGGQRRLIIPPVLAFRGVDAVDATGHVVVPGNSTLIVDVRLLTVDGTP
jgi:peptidylprolyl isomerase